MSRAKIVTDRNRSNAWWAGYYAAMRDGCIAAARCIRHPDDRLREVQSARKWNREMVRSLRMVSP